jgi:hypothetical protein
LIAPTKHSHPDQTVVFLAFLMLRELRKKRLLEYAGLLGLARREVVGGEAIFQPAVSLLFLLGLVEYRSKIDSFEFIGSPT